MVQAPFATLQSSKKLYLWLHFEAGIGEGLLEGDAAHQPRLHEGSSRDPFESNHGELEAALVERAHSIDGHAREVLALRRHQLRAERRLGALDEHVPQLRLSVDLNRNLVEVADGSWAASVKARMMSWGWTPSWMNGFALFSISAASTTTVVVPSPTSASCD
ncbi:hypothetical protein PMAYCL1PPCAC_21819 [Pristionchus mayeri]|uniref:Uncharacterized protein n=1 Tax=Pristionchus mayeri TaxID=1317129 RepID=A0AAN5CWY5_9BILA|nr:hypothetical protein PMAYCL1PPCAC_21819 [Pristionchus mayeri]